MFEAVIDGIDSKVKELNICLDAEFLIMKTLASELPAIKGRTVENGLEIEEKYYSALRKSQVIRSEINILLYEKVEVKQDVRSNDSATQYAKELEEKRAIKEACVTSATYERAQKRLFKEVDGFLSGVRKVQH
jgi:hypothetical protein